MRAVRAELPTPNGGGFDADATWAIEAGTIIDRIAIQINEGANAINDDQVDFIELTIDGDTRYKLSGDQIKMLAALKGLPNTQGRFTLIFSNMHNRTDEGNKLGQLMTIAGENVVLKIRLKAAVAGQVAPVYKATTFERSREAFGKDGKPYLMPRTTLPRIFADTLSPNAIGENTWPFPKMKSLVQELSLVNASVTKLEIKANGYTRFKRTAADNAIEMDEAGRSPQTDVFTFAPALEGFSLADSLDATRFNTIDFLYTVSDITPVPVVFETVERA